MTPKVRYRRVFTDDRRRRVTGGYVVFSTRHAAADPNSPELRQRAEVVDGSINVALPPNTYCYHARLTTIDGSLLELSGYVTLEAP